MSAAAWAARELARCAAFPTVAFSERLDEEVARHGQMFRFDIDGHAVSYRPKPPETIAADMTPALQAETRARADLYRDFLRDCLPLARLARPLSLALDVGDLPPEQGLAPFFAFQRRQGQAVMLLPDVDLLRFNFLEEPHWADTTRYRRKHLQAIFVGSTTGGDVTAQAVFDLSLPRLRAAAAFKGSDRVVFRLPRIVQCDSPEAEAAVRALGLGGMETSWAEQMRYRHLISMDGNGATCSRVAIALRSRCTLLKYNSPNELFYFPALQPWRHFVPIETDAEVEAAVGDSAARPWVYAAIARAGRRFFRAHLTRRACRRYVAALLRGYAERLG